MNSTIIGIHVHSTNYSSATLQVTKWGCSDQSRYVCVANVHMLMEAWDDPIFGKIVNSADLVTPDGMPLVWMLRLKGYKHQQRVYGPTLMLRVLEKAAQENIPVGFYGGNQATLLSLINRMQTRFIGLQVVYAYSPPFREITEKEDDQIIADITNSGARILFVGLGCPRQEKWMAHHREKLRVVMLGVGAAFDFHAGRKKQSPLWLQRVGLEWFFRLIMEPRRLARRYLYHNPRFIVLAIADLLGFQRTEKRP